MKFLVALQFFNIRAAKIIRDQNCFLDMAECELVKKGTPLSGFN
jgi:hypothetical protein